MRIQKALPEHIDIVRGIVRETIEAVFPHYFPRGAVDYFLEHHNESAIRADIDAGHVFIIKSADEVAATGTMKDGEISRLFVLPRYQNQGMGRRLMDFFEHILFRTSDEIRLDASLPALSFYRSRGYRETEFKKVKTKNGDYLCYYMMCLSRQSAPRIELEINYDGRRFAPLQNTPNGEVSGETVFCYHQEGGKVWADYSGGSIVKGLLTGNVKPDCSLEFAYVHVNDAGEVRVGECRSFPELLPDGRLLLHETWQWLNGDESAGASTLIETE
jgi:GNAT superfamily N-acetyltransferase